MAFLADIGVKWYARLEAGDDIHPSAATLVGIAGALRLSHAELEYMLELAGHHPVAASGGIDIAIPAPISALLDSARGVAVTIGDRILTPLRWNALSDAVYGHSRYGVPAERNALFRSLFDQEFITFLGPDREALVSRAVGMFRLNYYSPRQSPYVAEVHEKVKGHPLFQRAWNSRTVGDQLTHESVTVRVHPVVGKLVITAVDLAVPMLPDLFLRVLSPADDATAAKFNRLETIVNERRFGAASSLLA